MVPVNGVVELMQISNNKYQIPNSKQLTITKIRNNKQEKDKHRTSNAQLAYGELEIRFLIRFWSLDI